MHGRLLSATALGIGLVVAAMIAGFEPASLAGGQAEHPATAGWCRGPRPCAPPGGFPSLRGAARPAAGGGRQGSLAGNARRLGGVDCDDGSGAICGVLPVPLDWRVPTGQKLGLAWKLYVHTAPGRAESAITFNYGGPGERTIYPGDDGVHYVLGPLFETHDVLLIDDRGRGQSGALDCPALQHATGPSLRQRVDACVAQLGPTLDRYSSASIARDLEAVRAGLGIDRFDYVGNSYGTMDALAYASRYPRRVRSIVVAAGFGSTQFDFETMLSTVAAGIRRSVSVLCDRSVPCHAANPDPLGELARGAVLLRARPVEGDTFTPEGQPVHARVTEARLAFLAGLGDSLGQNAGELPAALAALRSGDSAPLLRIAASTAGVDEFFWFDGGEPTDWSVASFLATECVDNRTPPWGPGESYDQRIADALRRMRRLPDRSLAPWSAASLMELPGLVFEDQMLACRSWPDTPGGEAAVVDPSALPNVPVLGLEQPRHRRRRGAGRVASLPSQPVRRRRGHAAPRDVLALRPGADPGVPLDARARLADVRRRARAGLARAGGLPAHERGGQAPRCVAGVRRPFDGRRVAAVAVEAVLDAWWQLHRQCCGPAAGKGLRGGDWSWDINPDETGFAITLADARFSEDVAVSGFVFVPFASGDARAEITLVAPGGLTGQLVMRGPITFYDPVGTGLAVTGEIGSRSVALHAPVG